jgi:hypothetical protein
MSTARRSHNGTSFDISQHETDGNGITLPATLPGQAQFAISRDAGSVNPTRVNGYVDHTIYMDQGRVGSHLSVGPSGVIAPRQYGATGVVAAQAGDKIIVHGQISGGYGDYSTGHADGGTGVLISAGGMIANKGNISGGGGAYGGNGGVGIILTAGGMVGNAGSITGGGGGTKGDGGDGVNVTSGQISNKGMISGGTSRYYGNGGDGLVLNNGILTNDVHGGIVGGTGGYAFYSPGTGGTGLIAANSVLTNHGQIGGGDGGSGSDFGGDGGVGAMLSECEFTNTGRISGGAGGSVGRYGNGGDGGSGVLITGSTLTTSGVISGGAAGYGYFGGGDGGVGVDVFGGTLLAPGKISGGTGGQAGRYYHGGNGGAGVYLDGGTLDTSGTISGGAPGSGQRAGANGDAVKFGTTAATLIVDPGALFKGNVVGDNSNDTLALAAGGAAGTLSGVGSQFIGFTTIHEDIGAAWTLAGTTTVDTGTALDAAGSLTFASNLTGSGSVTIDSGATVTTGASVAVASLVFAAGGAEQLILDAPTAVTSTLSGFGTGDTIDLVHLLANSASFANGTLSLLEGTSVVASLTLAGNYTSNNFTLASDNNGGTTIVYVAGAVANPGAPPPDFGSSLDTGHSASRNFTALACGTAHLGQPVDDWTATLIAHWHVPQ